jgi:hypothetical protein
MMTLWLPGRSLGGVVPLLELDCQHSVHTNEDNQHGDSRVGNLEVGA